MSNIWTILQFVFFFGFLVFIHELGHMLVSKALGIEVEEFGFGYPPRLAKLFTWKGTEITLNWIPFGGFVRPKGETEANEPGGMLANGSAFDFGCGCDELYFGIILLIVMFSVAGGKIPLGHGSEIAPIRLHKLRVCGWRCDHPGWRLRYCQL